MLPEIVCSYEWMTSPIQGLLHILVSLCSSCNTVFFWLKSSIIRMWHFMKDIVGKKCSLLVFRADVHLGKPLKCVFWFGWTIFCVYYGFLSGQPGFNTLYSFLIFRTKDVVFRKLPSHIGKCCHLVILRWHLRKRVLPGLFSLLDVIKYKPFHIWSSGIRNVDFLFCVTVSFIHFVVGVIFEFNELI